MTNDLTLTILPIGQLVLYWLLGTIPSKKVNRSSIPALMITGFLIYYTLLELLALPMKLLHQPLSHLSVLWAGILLLFCLFVLLRRRDVLTESIRPILKCFRKEERPDADVTEKRVVFWILLLFTIVLAVWIGRNRNVISPYDAAYYIGAPVSSTYSNTLDAMNVYTGELMKDSYHDYLLNTDILHSAILFQLLNIHSLPERIYSFSMTMVVLFELMLFLFGQELFEKETHKYRKTAVFQVFATLLILEAYSLSSVSHRFVYRTYEGKSVVSYLYLSLIFLFCYILYKKREEKWPWLGLYLCTMSGVAFCNSAVFLIPGMIGTTAFLYILTEGLLKHNRRILIGFAGILCLSIFWILLYVIL